ncbi:hypothetical protein D4R87_01150 [bacterium]|nr:MAG: hypothetical protein D4R87_01150 [bacterium]
MKKDWTTHTETNCPNCSPEFLKLVGVVEQIIRNDANNLITGYAEETAKSIMEQLAHKYNLAPREE